MHKEVVLNFWTRVNKGNFCWLWNGTKDTDGYGRIRHKGVTTGAHRVSWEIHNGPIPFGLLVLHRCDIRSCVNPKHLFVGNQKQNVLDMFSKGRQADNSGEANPKAKLTWGQVRKIRGMVSHKFHNVVNTHEKIARMFGVKKSTIAQIAYGRTWKESPRV